MDALSLPADLLRRSDELQTRSARTRAAAAQRHATASQVVDKSKRLIAAAAKAQEAVLRACGGDPAGRGPTSVAGQGSVASVVLVGADPGGGVWLDAGQLQAVRQQARDLRQKSQQTIARARAARERASRGRSERQILQDSAYARLLAKQQTIGVIEQAKGIIVAQQGCGPEEAFDLLCRASQRTNVKVRDLAAQIIEHFSADGHHGNVAPITLGTRRYQRPRKRARPRPDDADQTPRPAGVAESHATPASTR